MVTKLLISNLILQFTAEDTDVTVVFTTLGEETSII
jgi:hypothetical protein